jgi:uncharacterized protein (DUF2062 family)
MKSLWDQIRKQHNTPGQVGGAVAVGLFLGTLPLYGIHLPLCIGAAWALKLNKITVYLAANISNPFVAPFLIAGGIALGEYLRFGQLRPLDLDQAHGFIDGLALLTGELPGLFLSCLLGDAVLGAGLGIVGGLAAWGLAWRWQSGRRAAHADPESGP